MELFVYFFLLIVLLVIRVPIAFSLALLALYIMLQSNIQMLILPQRMFSGADSFSFIALPLFVLVGILMNKIGISETLLRFVGAMVGHIRGGLSLVNIVFSMFFAGISGSSVADTAAVGTVIIPDMVKKGYPASYAAAVTSASSTIGIIIPPSIPMIVYGIVTGTSIRTLFIAGMIPGILLGLGQIVVAYAIAKKKNFPLEGEFSWEHLGQTFVKALPVLILPFIIIGGIVFGIFTPVEAGAVAVFYALVVDLILYHKIKWKLFYDVLLEAGIMTSIIMIIISASTYLGWALAYERIPQQIAYLFLGTVNDPVILLLLIACLLIFAGTFLHGAPLLIIIVPLLLPMLMMMEIDLVYFGMIAVICLGIGQQTPPVGSALYVTSAISGVDIMDVSKAAIPFILIIVAILLLVIFVPDVAMFLPSIIGR